MKRATRSRSADTVFVLLIFSTFAFSVLMVLMLAAGVYKNISDISRDVENERTAFSYVRTKVRNHDDAESLSVEAYMGVSALFIYERIGDVEYKTVIYSHNGWLCEIFSEASLTFALEDGIRISPISDLSFFEEDFGTIRVTARDMSMLLTRRSGYDISVGRGSE